MTSQQRHHWQQLCLMAVEEPDPKKQLAIVADLNRVLQQQRKRPHRLRCIRGLMNAVPDTADPILTTSVTREVIVY